MAQETTMLTLNLNSYRNPDGKPFRCVVLGVTQEAEIAAWIRDPERQGHYARGGYFGLTDAGRRVRMGMDYWIDNPDTVFAFKMRWVNGA